MFNWSPCSSTKPVTLRVYPPVSGLCAVLGCEVAGLEAHVGEGWAQRRRHLDTGGVYHSGNALAYTSRERAFKPRRC